MFCLCIVVGLNEITIVNSLRLQIINSMFLCVHKMAHAAFRCLSSSLYMLPITLLTLDFWEILAN